MKYVRVPAKQMQDFCVECFLKFGVPEKDAENIADHLVLANLRGVDSHGIMRIPYLAEGIRKGLVKPESEISVTKKAPGISLLDGGNGLGIPVATKATDLAVEEAKSAGVCMVGVRNLGHVGMLAYYTKRVAMLSISENETLRNRTLSCS
jgi:LDH2 family malate/lactate/ureidoglycolate dehydrogenase